MARSDVQTLGLLNAWQRRMFVDIWRFNQLDGQGVRLPQIGQAHPVYIQYERDYIANALAQAIDKATEYLGFPPAPMWIEDEIVTVDCDLRWNAQTLSTRWGHIQQFGKRAISLIDDDVTVTYTDANDDGLDETATITVTTSHPADEIEVFFRVADGAESAGSAYWRIEPLTVTKSGSTATITGHRALFAHPLNAWMGEYNTTVPIAKASGDTADADKFVTQVDVYRVYADATEAVQLLLNPAVVGATNAVVNATAHVQDSFMGHFTAYTADGQTAPGMQPVTLRVSYKAGLPLVNGQMVRALEIPLIKYANTLMAQQPTLEGAALTMWAEARKERDPTAYEAWYPPPFGLTNAGTELWAAVQARQNHLKGKLALGRQ